MSRKTNKLKGRLRVAEHAVREAREAQKRSGAEAARLVALLNRDAALTIKVADAPPYLAHHGKRFRIDFVADVFEWDFLRRSSVPGGRMQSIDDYAQMIARDLAAKVAAALTSHIAGREVSP